MMLCLWKIIMSAYNVLSKLHLTLYSRMDTLTNVEGVSLSNNDIYALIFVDYQQLIDLSPIVYPGRPLVRFYGWPYTRG